MNPPRIVVTQGEGAQGSLAAALAARGAEVVPLPTIAIEPPEDLSPLDVSLRELDRFDWIVFTSRHAVDAVAQRPAWEAAHDKTLPALRVAAVGHATAERLRELGVMADVVPSQAGGRALAEAIASASGRTTALPGALAEAPTAGRPEVTDAGALAGVRVLWPRSEIALRELPEALVREGAHIAEPVAYRTVVPAGADASGVVARIEDGSVDAIAFLSPSSARNLPALLGRPDLSWVAERTAIASIGPSTSEALRELGAPPSVESPARTAEDLADTLLSWLASRSASRRSHA